MRKRCLHWTLLVSFCLHILLIFIVLDRFHIDEPVSLQEIEIIITDQKEANEKKSASQAKPHGQLQKTGRRKLTLKSLMPQYDHQVFDPSKFGEVKNQSFSEMSADDVGRAMDVGQSAEAYPSLLWLYEKIDGHLSYPEELVMYERSGRITVELNIDETGVPYGNAMKVAAVDHVLKVYVLQVLDKSLAEPLPPTKKLPFPLKVKLVFDFLIIGEGHYPQLPQQILKNNLNFVRANIGSSWVQAWQRDQVRGANLRLESVYDDFSTYLKKRKYKKMGSDPLEKYKRDPRY